MQYGYKFATICDQKGSRPRRNEFKTSKYLQYLHHFSCKLYIYSLSSSLASQPSDDMYNTSTVVVLSPTVGRQRGARAR